MVAVESIDAETPPLAAADLMVEGVALDLNNIIWTDVHEDDDDDDDGDDDTNGVFGIRFVDLFSKQLQTIYSRLSVKGVKNAKKETRTGQTLIDTKNWIKNHMKLIKR